MIRSLAKQGAGGIFRARMRGPSSSTSTSQVQRFGLVSLSNRFTSHNDVRLRSYSSKDNQTLAKFTDLVLDRRRTPLGTLSAEQWEDCLAAMVEWLETGEEKLIGYSVDIVDRILHRLLAERATHSLASRGHESDLKPWLAAVVHAWLQMNLKHPQSLLALERADSLLSNLLLSWYRRGHFTDKDLPVEQGVAVLQSLLALRSPVGALRATQLLLSEHYAVMWTLDKTNVVPCFHEALKQAVEFAPDCSGCAESLMDEMKQLAEDPAWTGVQVKEEGLIQAMEGYFDEGLHSAKSALSPFEAEALGRRILQSITSAGEEDKETVEKLIRHWETTKPTSDGVNSFARELTDYYIRIGDPQLATRWLSSWATNSADAPGDKMERYTNVIGLWTKSGDSQAPWRAEELLERAEMLAKDAEVAVDDSLYASMANSWMTCSDPNAGRKALQLLQRMHGFDPLLFATVLRSSRGRALIVSDDVLAAIAVMERHWEALPSNVTTEAIESVATIIGESKLSDCAFELAQLFGRHTFVPAEDICVTLLAAFSETSDPQAVLELMASLAYCTPPSLKCYQTALSSLLAIRHRPKFDETRHLLTVLIDDVVNGLNASTGEVNEAMLSVLDAFTAVRRELDAAAVLEEAEEKLIPEDPSTLEPFPISLECYRKVATVFFVKDKYDDVEAIFDKVRNYYRSGHPDMAPDNRFYNLCMASLSKEGPHTLEEQEDLLNEISKLYTETAEERFKPIDTMFRGIFVCLQAQCTPEPDRALKWIEEVSRLGIVMSAPFCFNIAMHLVLTSDKSNAFELVTKVMDALQAAKVEPDFYTLHNVLKACAKANKSHREQALRTALETFEQIRERGFVNQTTYLIVLDILDRFAPTDMVADGTRDVISSIFDLFRQDGKLSEEANRHFMVYGSLAVE